LGVDELERGEINLSYLVTLLDILIKSNLIDSLQMLFVSVLSPLSSLWEVAFYKFGKF